MWPQHSFRVFYDKECDIHPTMVHLCTLQSMHTTFTLIQNTLLQTFQVGCIYFKYACHSFSLDTFIRCNLPFKWLISSLFELYIAWHNVQPLSWDTKTASMLLLLLLLLLPAPVLPPPFFSCTSLFIRFERVNTCMYAVGLMKQNMYQPRNVNNIWNK